MKRLMALAALAAASAPAVEMTDRGFKVTETAPAVRLVVVKYDCRGDIVTDRFNLTDPASSRRTVWFSDDVLAYHVCTNSTAYAVEGCIAATVARAGDRWSVLPSRAESAKGVRITSITVRGSVPEVTVDVDPKYGSTVAVEGKASLSDTEWRPATKEHRFFRAVQY